MAIAVVTGSSTGIGLATAVTLARAGHTVYATMRNPQTGGEEIRTLAEREHLPLRIAALDVDSDESVRNAFAKILAEAGRIDVLVIDDWAMAPLAESERRDFWEIAEDRYQTRSMILTSQLPVSRWHEQIGDPTLADGILDRLVHNAHRIEMRGESMRKQQGPKGEK